MTLREFIASLGRAQEKSTNATTPIEVYDANTGQRYEIVTVYTDVDEEKGTIVCFDIGALEE